MTEQLAAIHPLLPLAAGLIVLLLLALTAHLVGVRLFRGLAQVAATKTRSHWDNVLVENNVFQRLAQIIPAATVYVGIALVPGVPDAAETVVRNVANAYMIFVAILALIAVLSAANQIYEQSPAARNRPIKGFVQLAQLAVFVLGLVLSIAALIDRSPVILLSGLGAMAAVLLIVFKDTLLSLAASIQLAGQDLVRVGDWLEMPQFGADGDVIDVALYTVTVQNWDKTITTIPTYRLISDSFKNWRGMSESGGRRIKRSIYLDLASVRFLTPGEIEHFGEYELLQEYLKDKQQELREYNAALDAAVAPEINLRRLTNIGTFRAYLVNYLRHHPKIHQDMTLIVRQLQAGSAGVPIEIYCFTNDTDWTAYESIQGDIFDHVFAVVPEFGLRIYQQPSGADLSQWVESTVDTTGGNQA